MSIRSHTYRIIHEDGTVTEFPKRSYENERDALAAARRINALGHDIHRMVAYKCSKCNKWHVGHNHTVMTPERREKDKEKI